MNFDHIFQEFDHCATESRRHLEEMLTLISQGRVPGEESRRQADQSLTLLQQRYQAIRTIAKEKLQTEELPGEDASVAEYADAFRNSAQIKIQQRIEDAKSCLTKFLAVHSEMEDYTAALAEYQKEASTALDQLTKDTNEILDLEQIETQLEQLEGPKVFLNALECDDFDSNVGLTLYKQVQNYFSPCVQMGILREKYYLSLELDRVIPDLPTKKVDSSEFVKKLYSVGMIAKNVEEFGLMQVETNGAEEKKITSRIFQNALNAFHGTIKRISQEIIRELYRNGCVNEELLIQGNGLPEDQKCKNTLDYWKNQGYLRQYSVTPGGTIFCASTRLQKAMCYADACKAAGVQQRQIVDWGESVEDRVDAIAARVAMVTLRTVCLKWFRLKKYHCEESNTTRNNFFISTYRNSEDQGTIFATGAFWFSEEYCDEYLQYVREQYGDYYSDICCWICAGLNQTYAKKLTDCLMEELPHAEQKIPFYLYSLVENCYYCYPTLEPVERDALVLGTESEPEPKLEPEPKPEPEQQVDPLRYLNDAKELYQMLLEQRWYAATALMKVYSTDGEQSAKLYQQLAYALNDPMEHCFYSASKAYQLIGEKNGFEGALLLAIAVRLFFSNQVPYDHIQGFYDSVKSFEPANSITELSDVLYTLMNFKANYRVGMDAYAGYRTKSQSEIEAKLKSLHQEAVDYYNNFVVGLRKEQCSQKRFLLTKERIFSVHSDFGQYLRAVTQDEYEFCEIIKEFLQKHFYEPEAPITSESISYTCLWSYIEQAWEDAGDQMTYRKNMPLMSRLRSNITNETMKVVKLLAQWCATVEQQNKYGEDEGTIAYQKLQGPLLDQIASLRTKLSEKSGDSNTSLELKAGLKILDHALEEVVSCIDGSYDEQSRTYFYAPFLLTDDILLSKVWMPDLDMYHTTLQILQPENRIKEHVFKMRQKSISYEERLQEMLDGTCDNYGAASMLVEYLQKTTPQFSELDQSKDLETGEKCAKNAARLYRDDFVGELELAQSYGQIDNSVEDKKEKILRIADTWYEWAQETANYGFFRKVTDAYLAEIRETAKVRGSELLDQLKDFRNTTALGMSADSKEKRIAAIQTMIDQQNYTVAEELLARESVDEDTEKVDEEEDMVLQTFLDHYDEYYIPVSRPGVSFSALISSRTHNKEERGGRDLAENWLPGGGMLGSDRLQKLMNRLGFAVDKVEKMQPVTKSSFENYLIYTNKKLFKESGHCAHPITPFGSGATQQGFRVVCINGTYHADALIELMSQLGNTRHTMILLDCALTTSDRRRLARKVKSNLADKLFVVVDRVVMMYLIRHYDSTKINKMLISLTVPFGYYQPYVWESVNTMPPELFMGRKRELEQIKSSNGVNIVYGGRQLGKSALLKKAREDIDYNEKGDRAVYIDIKGRTYEEVAKKICNELYDQHILTEDLDTTDWDQLARALRCRLKSTSEPRIPYLLLLLDEADTFIDSCEEVNYKPFDALKEVQGEEDGRFKFVIAGLRNVVRFKREAALGNNSVLTHLKAMTVKPFTFPEARELMNIPLHYLGFRFPKEKESLVTLILASTNYFPGLIQLYCAKLLEAMRNRDYAGYNELDTPIYNISEQHIKKVLSDPEFMQQIRDKFMITLKVDEDKYYYLIALLIAYLYHINGQLSGYSAKDIWHLGKELEIPMITHLNSEKLQAFLEELKELNVLRSTDRVHYLFTRNTFFQMMGTTDHIEDELMEYMGT